jgi:DNA-cytosine methyltransferase
MRYVSVFSGIEAASVAFWDLGWEPVAFSEVDEFPCAVLAHRFPHVPNLGDIRKVDWKPYRGKVDLVVGGSPCFPGGTLITTKDGCKDISEIKAGDVVLTHKGRFRKVLSVGSKNADTIVLKGQGTCGIECTPNHPFYRMRVRSAWNNDKREYLREFSQHEWARADEMDHSMWLNVCSSEPCEIPQVAAPGKGSRGHGYLDGVEMGEPFFYFVGRWLADGWANYHQRKGRVDSKMKRVYVCCAKDKREELAERLSETGLCFSCHEQRTTYRFVLSSTQIYDWIVRNFGLHADGKHVPGWCLGIDERLRRSLFQGYVDADGCVVGGGYKASTVSKALAVGMKQLAGSIGYSVTITRHENHRDATIEGRHVNEKPAYVSTYNSNPRSAVMCSEGFWGLVRSVSNGHRGVKVYNLEVEEDHSYLADGVAVHNCQSFSIAGKREGLKGESGLMYEFIRCVREVRPRWLLWENVPGALSSERGAAFGQLLHELADGGGYGCAWRVLDAQFFGVAQRRRRIFLVGRAGNGYRAACQVLFEPDCVPGNSASSKAKRAELTARAGRSPRAAGFCNAAVKAGSIGYEPEQHPTLSAGSNLASTGAVIAIDCATTPKASVDVCHTLRRGGDGGSNDFVTYAFAQNQRREVRLDGTDGQTVGAIPATRSGKQFQGVLCMASGSAHAEVSEDVGTTLSARQYKDPPITVVTRCGCEGGGKGALASEDVSLTLSTRNEQSLFDPHGEPRYVVRRLTPVECERLQGFPDNWTRVPYRGRAAGECPDGPRYKAIGNSMAVPVMRWIGRRMQEVDNACD